MDRVKVNMQNVFACGQAYVALSRARSMAGLQVINFGRGSVMIDQEVAKWYGRLQRRLAAIEYLATAP